MFLFTGGVAYTIGAILYGIGKKKKYVHSIFHLFVVAGSILHFFMILFYVILYRKVFPYEWGCGLFSGFD